MEKEQGVCSESLRLVRDIEGESEVQAIYDLKKNLKQKGKRRRTEAYI